MELARLRTSVRLGSGRRTPTWRSLSFHECTLLAETPLTRFVNSRELGRQAVAGVFYDPAPVLFDFRIDQLADVGLELLVRPLLLIRGSELQLAYGLKALTSSGVTSRANNWVDVLKSMAAYNFATCSCSEGSWRRFS